MYLLCIPHSKGGEYIEPFVPLSRTLSWRFFFNQQRSNAVAQET
jgi:hypothetical protein